MNFYKAKEKMEALLSGDIALESLELVEDEYLESENNGDTFDEFENVQICEDCGAEIINGECSGYKHKH